VLFAGTAISLRPFSRRSTPIIRRDPHLSQERLLLSVYTLAGGCR